ncbi:hypothetical protein [Paenibacillus polymyxa]|uniref:hypothetical protein n=1 Tax=Paenibacillus polymyxa TaxID=1406 RepID=UPI0021E38C21|nr:hypothetical protein [Paenibacillus polymyxa]
MISVFLSYPQPHMVAQQKFITVINNYLVDRGFSPRTLGVTDYDMDAPLTTIRRLMLESNGLITVAFRRAYIEKGQGKLNSDLGSKQYNISGQWLTSPYCHIEPAMAFQLGLPILILRETGVLADGILEKGVTGTYLPEFDLSNDPDNYLCSSEWLQIIGKWEGYLRKVAETKGCPPKLY